jgi:hypothetical protein
MKPVSSRTFSGKTKKALVEACRKVPMKLEATATPSPNEVAELTCHADFLGVMSPRDMLTIFFTTKGLNGKYDGRFRLKDPRQESFLPVARQLGHECNETQRHRL